MDELDRLRRQNRLLTGALVLLIGVLIGSRHSVPEPHVVVLPPVPRPPVRASPSTTSSTALIPDATDAASGLVAGPGHVHVALAPYTRAVVLHVDDQPARSADLELPPGVHRFSLQGPEIEPVQLTVTVAASQHQTVIMKVVRLASLLVRAEPEGSHVVVRGPGHFHRDGPAPLAIRHLRPGRYRVEVTHRGCEGLVMQFHLPPGSRLEKMAELPQLAPVALVLPQTRPRPRLVPAPDDVPAPKATEVEDDTESCPTPEVPGVPVPGVKATPQ